MYVYIGDSMSNDTDGSLPGYHNSLPFRAFQVNSAGDGGSGHLQLLRQGGSTVPNGCDLIQFASDESTSC